MRFKDRTAKTQQTLSWAMWNRFMLTRGEGHRDARLPRLARGDDDVRQIKRRESVLSPGITGITACPHATAARVR
jgi:hypothetical protein